MRRLSVCALVFAIPLGCALILALWNHQRDSRRATTIQLYNGAVSRGDTLPIPRLVNAFGDHFAKLRVAATASENSDLIFDGESRVAQIERATVSDGDETGDGIVLYTFGSKHGLHHYHAPVVSVLAITTTSAGSR